MELWSYPWWMLGIISLTALFMLLLGLFLASQRLYWELPHGFRMVLDPAYMDSTPLGSKALEHLILQHTPDSERQMLSRLDLWVTRIFIVIVLQCAALYLISAYPGAESPLWLGFILQGFTYVSAAVYYASLDGDP